MDINWVWGGAALVVAVVLIRLFATPLKFTLRLLGNALLGLLALYLLQKTAPWTGIELGINWWNTLTVGVLGLPGLGLLLLLQWIF